LFVYESLRFVDGKDTCVTKVDVILITFFPTLTLPFALSEITLHILSWKVLNDLLVLVFSSLVQVAARGRS